MPKVEFFLGRPKQVEFEAKRPMIVEESKVQSNYTENDPQAPSHILNRPFYSETVTEPLEITWDGVWGGRPYMVIDRDGLDGMALIKVSDTVFDLEQLKDSYVTILSTYGDLPNATIPFSSLEVTSIDLGTGFAHMVTSDGLPVFAILTNDVFFEGNSYEKGTYFGTVRLSDSAEGDYSIYTSALSFPSVTYEKHYKLSNKYVDAEWMATESAGEGEKRFDLETVADLFILGERKGGVNLYRLDSRAYTKDELLSARLTLRLQEFEVTYAVVGAEEWYDFVSASLVGFTGSFVLLSVFQDGAIFEKGLYFDVADNDIDLDVQATLEMFNVAGQIVPNRLPNKFLDLDWLPKAETYTDTLYSGVLSPNDEENSIIIQYDPQLRNFDTVLLFEVDGVTREASCLGVNIPGEQLFAYTVVLDGEDILMVNVFGSSAILEYQLKEPAYVSIKIVKKKPNPIPDYFLPPGVGSTAVINIAHPLSDGLDGYEVETNAAWNSGARVVLKFTDETLTLASYALSVDGVKAVGVTSYGRIYLFDPISRGDGWALSLDAGDENASVLFKANGDTEFKPTFLNSTLTEGSTLPAQEGAVFTAIQGLENTIGTLNQDLENRLNGGT